MTAYLKRASVAELERWRSEHPANDAVAARLAQVLLNRNRDDEALTHIDEALRLQSERAEYWYIQALILRKLGRLEEAVASWERAVGLSPVEGKSYMLGDLYLDRMGRSEDAIRIYTKVLRYSGREPALISLRRLGQCCLHNATVNEALLRAERAIATFLPPIRALEGLAQGLAEEGRYDESRLCCEVLLSEAPDNLAAQMTMARIATEQKHDLAGAEGHYLKALARHYSDLDLHRSWMFHLVRAGDYERARQHFVQFFLQDPRRMPALMGRPLTNGVDLRGKTLLLAGRPGFGDYFQLLRFASLFHEQGAHVTVECVESLWDLLLTIPGIDGVTEEGSDSTEYDYQADTWTLFLYFKDCLKFVYESVPYIFPPASLLERWRKRLDQPEAQLKVGFAWSSSLPSRNKFICRDVPLPALDGLSRASNVKYYCVQFTAAKNALAQSALPIFDLAPELSPFSEAAGAFMNLDLIVTVDSSVAHLAGALGTQTFVLLPFSPDFRWMFDRDDCPWYPTARLFRQTVPGDWSTPISQVASTIAQLAAAKLSRIDANPLALSVE
jgi:tetratricopeptide (TPR) repeat protein